MIANRLNAQKSTGPRSSEGKAISRFNALKHAATAKSLVIPGEDENALAGLTASYEDFYQPVGPEEELFVEKIVTADWTQRRMRRIQAEVLRALIAQQETSNEGAAGAAVIQDSAGSNALQKVFRCREAAGREWYRARKELLLLQAERQSLAPQSVVPKPIPVPAASAPPPEPVKTEPPPVDGRPQTPAARPVQFTSQPQSLGGPIRKMGFFDETTPKAWRL